MNQFKFSVSTLHPKTKSFLESLESFSELVVAFEYKVKPYSEESLKHFLGLELAKQEQIISNFDEYHNFFRAAFEQNINLRDDCRLLKTFTDRLGLIFGDDVFSTIRDGDVIEVYTSSLIQIYRNLAFMNLSTYTLLDLLSYEFYELFNRSETVNKYIFEAANTLSNRDYALTAYDMSHVPHHLVQERFSQEKLSIFVKFNRIYPLYTWPQKFYGYLIIQRAKEAPMPLTELSFI